MKIRRIRALLKEGVPFRGRKAKKPKSSLPIPVRVKLTQHARQRVNERTNMLETDVLELLKRGVTADLGRIGKYSYRLFYSAPDERTKVAIVAGPLVVSIWENNYELPKGIVISPSKKHEAREKYWAFVDREYHPLDSKILSTASHVLRRPDLQQTSKVVPPDARVRTSYPTFEVRPGHYAVRVEVMVKGQVIYRHDADQILVADVSIDSRAREALLPAVLEVARLVREYWDKADGLVFYDVRLKPSWRDCVGVYRFEHEKIKLHLEE